MRQKEGRQRKKKRVRKDDRIKQDREKIIQGWQKE
jgi:hypothetical protein